MMEIKKQIIEDHGIGLYIDKEFKKTIEDNDEFNERNNPTFID